MCGTGDRERVIRRENVHTSRRRPEPQGLSENNMRSEFLVQ
jgi:hypothetical protein